MQVKKSKAKNKLNINPLKFELFCNVDNYVKLYDIIFVDDYKTKFVVKNTATNQLIEFDNSIFKAYENIEVDAAYFKYNQFTNEHYLIQLLENKNAQKSKQGIIAIYSLQNKKLVADFLINDYEYYYYIRTGLFKNSPNKFDMLLVNNNKTAENRNLFKQYIYNICNDKLVRIKIKKLYRYGISTYSLLLLKTTPLLAKKHSDDKNKTVLFNFNINEEFAVPFNIVNTINDMYCIYFAHNRYSLINPFNYTTYMQLNKHEIDYKIITKALV